MGEASEDVPFELVGQVARAGAVAEACDVERGAAAARHVVCERRGEIGLCMCMESSTRRVYETSLKLRAVGVLWSGLGVLQADKKAWEERKGHVLAAASLIIVIGQVRSVHVLPQLFIQRYTHM